VFIASPSRASNRKNAAPFARGGAPLRRRWAHAKAQGGKGRGSAWFSRNGEIEGCGAILWCWWSG